MRKQSEKCEAYTNQRIEEKVVSCKTNIAGNNKLEKKQPNKMSEILINAIMCAQNEAKLSVYLANGRR